MNTFTFLSLAEPLATHMEAVATQLRAIYNIVSTADGATRAIGEYFSPYVKRGFEVRCYDMTAPEGSRVPTVFDGILPEPMPNSQGLPEEVAAVLSFQAAPPITPRKRGRVYLGPLNHWATTYGTASAPTRIEPAFMAICLHEFFKLADVPGLGWVVHSAGAREPRASTDDPLGDLLPAESYSVRKVWMDNALDTQRRRGADPSFRGEVLAA